MRRRRTSRLGVEVLKCQQTERGQKGVRGRTGRGLERKTLLLVDLVELGRGVLEVGLDDDLGLLGDRGEEGEELG